MTCRKWGQASTLRIPSHIPRVRWAGSPDAFCLVAVSRRTLALLGVPKWRRVAICLTENVVSLHRRAAISSLAGSCLRRDASSAGWQPKRTSSSLIIRSALACAVSRRAGVGPHFLHFPTSNRARMGEAGRKRQVLTCVNMPSPWFRTGEVKRAAVSAQRDI